MIPDLDETLKQLLIQKGGLDPSVVDIRFDALPTGPIQDTAKPVVNLQLYDIRENVEAREVYWDTTKDGDKRVRITRRPLRIDLSYLITCQTSRVDERHRLLWQVMGTLFQNSPLPDEILQGELHRLLRPAQTKVAQPDGILNTSQEIGDVLRQTNAASINLVVTLELDLNDVRIEPLVFARTLKIGQIGAARNDTGQELKTEDLEPGWEVAPTQFGGVVRSGDGQPLEGIAVRLVTAGKDQVPVQVGASVVTDESGRYRFNNVPLGQYGLVVEPPGQPPQQQQVQIAAGERGQPVPDLNFEVVIATRKRR